MKTFYSFLLLLFFSALAACGNDVEKNHLKLYASFDHSAKPEIALEGSGFRTAGKLVFIEGKSGKALRFSRKSEVGDLLYNLGTTMNGKEWSIAMWICPEERPKKNGEVPGRNLFRTNFGWGSGNVFAGFDNWGRFILNHFDAEKKYRGAAISAAAIPYDQWTHIVFGYKNGKHVIYLNGIEAAYTRNNDVLKVGPNQTVLRIGSMDFRSRDQFGGSIDELKLFNKLLTASEAKQIMETTPGKEQIEPLLFAPFEGKIDAAGISGFNAAQLLFTKGRNGDGVKVVRHGYDRKGSLVLNGISGIGGNPGLERNGGFRRSRTFSCYFRIFEVRSRKTGETTLLLHPIERENAGNRSSRSTSEKRKDGTHRHRIRFRSEKDVSGCQRAEERSSSDPFLLQHADNWFHDCRRHSRKR